MRASFGYSRSVSLRIKGMSVEDSESGRPGCGLGSPVIVVVGVPPVGYLLPPDKGKEKISKIKYPCGSYYLRASMRYADVVGPSQVEPSFAKTFATRYGPPSGVRIWCPDLLTSYVVPVPKMVCVATPEPGLTRLAGPNRNPGYARLKPLTKSVYQIHFILKCLRK